jgi:hypothetical protein
MAWARTVAVVVPSLGFVNIGNLVGRFSLMVVFTMLWSFQVSSYSRLSEFVGLLPQGCLMATSFLAPTAVKKTTGYTQGT